MTASVISQFTYPNLTAMISEEVKEALSIHFPDFPRDTANSVPSEIYEWLVCNVSARDRANWTDKQIHDDFMNNEGRMEQFRFDG